MLLRLLCFDDGDGAIGGGPARRSFNGIIAIERIRGRAQRGNVAQTLGAAARAAVNDCAPPPLPTDAFAAAFTEIQRFVRSCPPTPPILV